MITTRVSTPTCASTQPTTWFGSVISQVPTSWKPSIHRVQNPQLVSANTGSTCRAAALRTPVGGSEPPEIEHLPALSRIGFSECFAVGLAATSTGFRPAHAAQARLQPPLGTPRLPAGRRPGSSLPGVPRAGHGQGDGWRRGGPVGGPSRLVAVAVRLRHGLGLINEGARADHRAIVVYVPSQCLGLVGCPGTTPIARALPSAAMLALLAAVTLYLPARRVVASRGGPGRRPAGYRGSSSRAWSARPVSPLPPSESGCWCTWAWPRSSGGRTFSAFAHWSIAAAVVLQGIVAAGSSQQGCTAPTEKGGLFGLMAAFVTGRLATVALRHRAGRLLGRVRSGARPLRGGPRGLLRTRHLAAHRRGRYRERRPRAPGRPRRSVRGGARRRIPGAPPVSVAVSRRERAVLGLAVFWPLVTTGLAVPTTTATAQPPSAVPPAGVGGAAAPGVKWLDEVMGAGDSISSADKNANLSSRPYDSPPRGETPRGQRRFRISHALYRRVTCRRSKSAGGGKRIREHGVRGRRAFAPLLRALKNCNDSCRDTARLKLGYSGGMADPGAVQATRGGTIAASSAAVPWQGQPDRTAVCCQGSAL